MSKEISAALGIAPCAGGFPSVVAAAAAVELVVGISSASVPVGGFGFLGFSAVLLQLR